MLRRILKGLLCGLLLSSCSGGDHIVDSVPSGPEPESPDAPSFIAVSSVRLDRDSLFLYENETAVLKAEVLPSDATDPSVRWSTSDSTVAAVGPDGLVEARKEGEAEITVLSGGERASCHAVVLKRIIPVESVRLDRESLHLTKGETFLLTATLLPETATDRVVSWMSSDETVVSVGEDGLLTALAGGSVTVTASAGKESARCEVLVTVPVQGLFLTPEMLSLTVGDTASLTAAVQPADATEAALAWFSSDARVASVDSLGGVTAQGPGEAEISVACGAFRAVSRVAVSARVVPVEAVGLSPQALSLEEGGSARLQAVVTPSDATDAALSWSSSDPRVAAVDSSGTVTALREGTAEVTASAGGKKAVCTVTVRKKVVPVEAVRLDRDALELTEGETADLSAEVLPEEATDQKVFWLSSNPRVAAVDSSGTVTALREGTAEVTASAGGKKAVCTVAVRKKVIPVETVTISADSLALVKGKSVWLTARVSPENATYGQVEWTSSSSETVSVERNGKVTALSGGDAVVTASAGGKQASCHVHVDVPVKTIRLDRTLLTMYEKEEAVLTATVSPADATDAEVSWTSTEPSVVEVSSSGHILALKAGTAKVRASAGGRTATCTVTVVRKVIPVASVSLDKTEIELKPGESETLQAEVLPADATDRTVVWESWDPMVATVNAHGTVKAKGIGTATIAASAGGVSALCKVTVIQEAASIRLNLSSVDLAAGSAVRLQVYPEPMGTVLRTAPRWTSSRPSVATVTADGLVTAVQPGQAVVTATVGRLTASCTVAVSPRPVSGDLSETRTFRTGSPDPTEDNIDRVTFDRTVLITYSAGGVRVDGDADGAVSVRGKEVTVRYDGSESIVYELVGNGEGGSFKLYSNRRQALCLNGVSLSSSRGAAINIQSRKRTYVYLKNTNSLSDAPSYAGAPAGEDEKGAFFSEGQLVFSGPGQLEVYAVGKSGIVSDDYIRMMSAPKVSVHSCSGHAVRAKEAVIVSDGVLEATAEADTKKAVNSDSLVCITGGTVLARATGSAGYDGDGTEKGVSAVKADRLFRMEGGRLTALVSGAGAKAVNGDGNGLFTGGRVEVEATGSSWAGKKAAGIHFGHGLVFDGAEVTVRTNLCEGISTSGELVIRSGRVFSRAFVEDAFNSGKNMTISGGMACGISYRNDAFDSNRNLYVRGGLVYAHGAGSPEHALDAATEIGCFLYLEGGTVIALGALQERYQTSRRILSSDFVYGTSYALCDREGNTLFSFRTEEQPDSSVRRMYILLPSDDGMSEYTLMGHVALSGGSPYFDGLFRDGGTYSGGSPQDISYLSP